MKNKHKMTLLIVLMILAVMLFMAIVWVAFVKKDSTSSKSSNNNSVSSSSNNKVELVACTSTASTQPVALAGWKTRLYGAPLQDSSSNADVPDNGARSFSIKALADKTSPNSLYNRVEHSDGSVITGAKSVMEVCNKDNKAPKYYTTATDTTSTPASSNTTAQTHFLHGGGYTAGGPGEYRIDAYVYENGKWNFTSRITGVTFTE